MSAKFCKSVHSETVTTAVNYCSCILHDYYWQSGALQIQMHFLDTREHDTYLQPEPGSNFVLLSIEVYFALKPSALLDSSDLKIRVIQLSTEQILFGIDKFEQEQNLPMDVLLHLKYKKSFNVYSTFPLSGITKLDGQCRLRSCLFLTLYRFLWV